MKKILELLSVKFQFLVVKFSIYLNRRVFVMHSLLCIPVFAFSLLPNSMRATLRGAYSIVRSYDNQFTILLYSRGRPS